MMARTPPLTFQQIVALRAYMQRKGRNWKEALRTDWQRGTANACLHHLRNTHGVRWLQAYSAKPLTDSDAKYLQWRSERDKAAKAAFPKTGTKKRRAILAKMKAEG